MKAFLIAGLLGSTLIATGAMAQSAPATSQAAPPATSNSSAFITRLDPNTTLASDLMDQDVVGPDNKDIGEVEDLIMDRSGRVVAVVVEIDEGLGDRTLALPMSAFRMSAPDAATTGSVQGSNQTATTSAARNDDMNLVLNIPVDQLKSAPEFDDND